MNLSPGLHLRQQQKLVMTPMLQQALKILQLNNLELTDLVQQELSENPLLEEAEPGAEVDPEEAPPVEDADHPAETSPEEPVVDMDAISRETPLSESFDLSEPSEAAAEPSTPEIDITERTAPPDDQWEDYFTDAGTQEGFTRENGNPDRDPWENIAGRRPSLQQHLWTQLEDREPAPALRRAAEAILGAVDERGYLSASLESLAGPDLDRRDLFAAMRLVQGFDPPGVAARDLRECLLLQLEARGRKHSLAWRIVSDHLEELKSSPRLLLALAVDEDEVSQARREIASLEPVPGRAFGGEAALAVTIDAVIDKDEQGQYRVTVPEGRMPSLGINHYYRKMLKAAAHDKGATTQYLNEKYQAALWLLKSIDQRKKTLQRVVEAMVDVQRGFFDDGPSAYRPLTLKDIAAVTQLHESTISRVTSGKYAQTPRGIFDLKFFFSGGFKTDSGSDASAPAVKERLRQLVAEEDPRRPLADQRLADLLKAGGVTIARRTVAKYREELRILPATQRKSVPS